MDRGTPAMRNKLPYVPEAADGGDIVTFCLTVPDGLLRGGLARTGPLEDSGDIATVCLIYLRD